MFVRHSIVERKLDCLHHDIAFLNVPFRELRNSLLLVLYTKIYGTIRRCSALYPVLERIILQAWCKQANSALNNVLFPLEICTEQLMAVLRTHKLELLRAWPQNYLFRIWQPPQRVFDIDGCQTYGSIKVSMCDAIANCVTNVTGLNTSEAFKKKKYWKYCAKILICYSNDCIIAHLFSQQFFNIYSRSSVILHI